MESINNTASANQSSLGNASATGPLIPLLRTPPPTMDGLIEHLRSLQYNIVPLAECVFEKEATFCPPQVAFVPLSARTNLDHIKQSITTYVTTTKSAPTTFLGAYTGRRPFGINELHDAGLHGIFHSPFEDQLLINKLYELAPISTNSKKLNIDQLFPVRLGDIEKMKVCHATCFFTCP